MVKENTTRKLMVLPSVPSTNTYLKEHPELWSEDYLIVQTRDQTEGKGRYQRTWYSQKDLDLTFSILIRADFERMNINIVTFCTGLAVCRSIRRIIKDEEQGKLKLKWPNDILFGKKKLSGILCELVFGRNENDGKGWIIIGIGVNVNSVSFPVEIESAVTSIKKIIGRESEVDLLRDAISDELYHILINCSASIPEPMLAEWTSSSNILNERIFFVHKGRSGSGRIKCINSDGSLSISEDCTGKIILCREEIYYAPI